MSTISPLPTSPLASPLPSDMSPSLERERERPQSFHNPALSRPLSEISENESNRRSNRSSVHSRKERDKDKDKGDFSSKEREKSSRPTSEVKEDSSLFPTSTTGASSPTTKRLTPNMPVQTITVNLVEYGKTQPPLPPSPAPTSTVNSVPSPSLSPPVKTSASSTAKEVRLPERPKSDIGEQGPPPPSPSTKPPELPRRPERGRTVSGSSRKQDEKDLPKGTNGSSRVEQVGESSKGGVSSFLLAKRASLRPSPLGGSSYADVAKPTPSPTLSADSHTSIDSPRSSSDLSKPATKTKPSWLRRASGTAALRTKSKSPAPKEDGISPASTSLPPTLPPRKGLDGSAPLTSSSSQSLADIDETMQPPRLPARGSYATVVASANVAGPSRSRLADGQGRPAFSPPTTSSGFGQPPALPSRDHVGNIRGRLAAWTAVAQSSNGGFARSESSNSIASQAGPSSGYPQRFPASAQRVLGHAGSAVQKGWAGLRARGVGGSISSMSGIGQSSRSQSSMGPSSSWGSGIARRGSRDRTQSDEHEFRSSLAGSDGPVFPKGVIKREAQRGIGKVFGRDVGEAGKEWGVVDLEKTDGDGEMSEMEKRRRKCLPAVVIRSVEYLVIWGPKEEGIFRISGRNSHIARLRKEFDAGADIDLTQCDPGDLDPHAVAGLFKSYLRELPSPLLTTHLAPRFDAYVKGKSKMPGVAQHRASLASNPADNGGAQQEDMTSLLQQLPQAHWFLLADIVKLLDLIPRHAHTNRMTLNALMLSLGPSLNISGGVLNELLDRQDELFSEPPRPSGTEAANDLIDFGETSIPPVEPPTASTMASSNWPSDDQEVLTVPATGTPKKKSPRLPARPSLTKLFGTSYTSLPRQKSVETLNSISTVEPPRVEIAMSPTSPLPTFDGETNADSSESSAIENIDNGADHKAIKGMSIPPLQPAKPFDMIAASVPIPETPISGTVEQLDDTYSPATVEERAKLFSTPIADKFSGTSSPFPSLRAKAPRSSNGSVGTIGSSNDGSGSVNGTANPASVIRRGPPVFFQSAAVERHGHARSASSSSQMTSSHGVSQVPPQGQGQGTKRKDEGNEDSEGEEGRGKRLSAGPSLANESENQNQNQNERVETVV